MKKNKIEKSTLINVGIILVSLLVTLVVLEFGFRFFIKLTGRDIKKYALKKDYDVSNYLPHPFLIYTLRPNLRKEQFVTNSHGYRGREFNLIKEEDTIRIVCIGESTTFGAYISDEDTYPRQLEEILQKKFTRKIEVINAGICSYTSMETLYKFLLDIVPLKPDIVISHQGVNDVRPRAYPNFKSDYSHYRKTWSAPTLQPVFYKIIKRTYHMAKYSWLYQFVIFRLTNFNRDIVYYTDKNEWLGIDCWPGELDRQTASTFERNMRYLAVLSKANNIKLLFVTIPFRNNANYQETLPKYVQGLNEHNQIVKKIAQEFHTPVLELDALMTGDYDYFKDIIHVNSQGAKLKAENIYKAIISNNLIPE